MALEVVIVSGSGQEHAGCLLLTSEVLFVVSLSEDTQQQAFPITEVILSHSRFLPIVGPKCDNWCRPAGGVSAGARPAGPAHPDPAAADHQHGARGEAHAAVGCDNVKGRTF